MGLEASRAFRQARNCGGELMIRPLSHSFNGRMQVAPCQAKRTKENTILAIIFSWPQHIVVVSAERSEG
jgi:hypothetical protein